MQTWFLFALLAPLLWSFINHIDKFLLSKYSAGKGVGSLIVFSSMFAVVVLPLISVFHYREIFNPSPFNLALLLTVGVTNAIAVYCYLKAMDTEEASVVVMLLQLVPIFAYFLGFLILGETLTLFQIVASLIIIVGVIIISIEVDLENKYKLKKKALFWIAVSSLLFALHDVAFKLVTTTETFWVSSFWQYAGMAFFGFLLIWFSPTHRHELFKTFQGKNSKLLGLNVVSETLYILGNLANNFATLLAPVAIVLVVSSYQPLFVFVEAIILTVFFPKIILEKITLKHIIHKIFSMVIIIVGSYLLYISTH